MLFEEFVRDNRSLFIEGVEKISKELGIEAEWLMLAMYFESRLRPDAVNKISGATGLIQFMPTTAKLLGTSVSALKEMSNVEQLVYVKRYLFPYRRKMKDWLDVYCAIFYPKLIGKPDSYRITSDIVAVQNKIFDLNKDRDIEKGEIRKVLKRYIPSKYLNNYV